VHTRRGPHPLFPRLCQTPLDPPSRGRPHCSLPSLRSAVGLIGHTLTRTHKCIEDFASRTLSVVSVWVGRRLSPSHSSSLLLPSEDGWRSVNAAEAKGARTGDGGAIGHGSMDGHTRSKGIDDGEADQ
jgi:hypothetical protein